MPSDHLSAIFAALADPTRRAILARLANGEMTVTELAEPFDLSLPAISKHLKVLERAGLVERRRNAQLRPTRLDAAALKEASDWLETYRHIWEDRFSRLDDYLHELQSKQRQSEANQEKENQTSENQSEKTQAEPDQQPGATHRDEQ